MTKTLVEVNHLSRRYGALTAVDDIGFQLHSGDVLGFLGPNGAGKSTTMQMLSGNLAPTAGEIFIDGVDLLDDPVRAKAALGYLPDTPPLYRDMTAREYLQFCAGLRRVPRARQTRQVDRALEQCGLTGVCNRLIETLSKGYQQRLGIAQAILHRPPLIILDEPTVGLDPLQILDIRQLIHSLSADHGILLSTHILPEVEAVCNRVQIIHQGRLVYQAAIDAFAQRTAGDHYEVAFDDELTAGALRHLDDVEQVEALGNGRFRLQSSLPAAVLCQRLVALDRALVHFAASQSSLEQHFTACLLGEQAHHERSVA